MSSRPSHSRTASNRSQSLTWRWTSGSGTRRRSGRGGKSRPRAAGPGARPPQPELLPHQERVRQHHRDRVPVEPGPQPPLVLVPPEQPLRLLVVLLDPVPPVGVPDQPLQRHLRAEVAPVELPPLVLPARLPLPDQPPDVPLAVGRHPPAPHGGEPAPQPPLAPLPPPDRPPHPGRQRRPAGRRPAATARRPGGRSATAKSARTATTYCWPRSSSPARKFGLSP